MQPVKEEPFDWQESKGRQSRISRQQRRSQNPQVQERAAWHAAGWIEPEIWNRSWQQDSNGEWIWVDQQDSQPTGPPVTPGSQRWKLMQQLSKELTQKQQAQAAQAATLLAHQQMLMSIQQQSIAQNAALQADLNLRQQNIAAAEAWWLHTQHAQAAAYQSASTSSSSWQTAAPPASNAAASQAAPCSTATAGVPAAAPAAVPAAVPAAARATVPAAAPAASTATAAVVHTHRGPGLVTLNVTAPKTKVKSENDPRTYPSASEASAVSSSAAPAVASSPPAPAVQKSIPGNAAVKSKAAPRLLSPTSTTSEESSKSKNPPNKSKQLGARPKAKLIGKPHRTAASASKAASSQPVTFVLRTVRRKRWKDTPSEDEELASDHIDVKKEDDES